MAKCSVKSTILTATLVVKTKQKIKKKSNINSGKDTYIIFEVAWFIFYREIKQEIPPCYSLLGLSLFVCERSGSSNDRCDDILAVVQFGGICDMW